MRNIKDLSDAEAQGYSIDMTEANSAAIESVIRIADKHGTSRDEAMKHFSTVMVVMAETTSFEGYELNKEEANENWG